MAKKLAIKNINYLYPVIIYLSVQFIFTSFIYSQKLTMNSVNGIPNDTIDVVNFGIINDGLTDNTERLNKICDSIPLNTVLYFRKGNYYIAGVVRITKSNRLFSGNNAAILLGESRNVQPCTGFYIQNAVNVTIEGMTFLGEHKENESALWIENSDSVQISFCKFENIGFIAVMLTNTLKSSEGHGSRYCSIINNYFTNINIPGKNLGTSIFLFSSATYNRVEDNVIVGPGWTGIGMDDATTKSLPPFLPSTNNIIVGNSILQMYGSGILIEGSSHNQLLENKIDECKIGILINNAQHQNPSDSNIVKKNIIMKSTENSISIVGSSFNDISSNTIGNCGNHGISFQQVYYPGKEMGSSQNHIYSNFIFGSRGFGININDIKCLNNTTEDNTFIDNRLGNLFIQK